MVSKCKYEIHQNGCILCLRNCGLNLMARADSIALGNIPKFRNTFDLGFSFGLGLIPNRRCIRHDTRPLCLLGLWWPVKPLALWFDLWAGWVEVLLGWGRNIVCCCMTILWDCASTYGMDGNGNAASGHRLALLSELLDERLELEDSWVDLLSYDLLDLPLLSLRFMVCTLMLLVKLLFPEPDMLPPYPADGPIMGRKRNVQITDNNRCVIV